MAAIGANTIAHVLKLPSSAVAPPSPSIQPQLVSRQLGLITDALKTGNQISELTDCLELTDSQQPSPDKSRGNEPDCSNSGFLSGLLSPPTVAGPSGESTAIPEKLAAVTNAANTGNSISAITKLLGAGALPAPAPEFVQKSLLTIEGVLSANNLIPDRPPKETLSLSPESVSAALATVANTLKSQDFISNPTSDTKKNLESPTPLPASDAVDSNGALSNLTPRSISDAFEIISEALESSDLVSPGGKDLLGILPVTPDSVSDALKTITFALHANDLVADATDSSATIFPPPSAQIVSDTLQAITAALSSGVSSADIEELGSTSGLPNAITEAMAVAIENINALPTKEARAVSSTLGTISNTLISSDQPLDATGAPESAIIAPITPMVAQTLETVATLDHDTAKSVSDILISIADAVTGGGAASNTLLTSDLHDMNPVTVINELLPDAPDTNPPDADNSTNSNPQPDGHRGKRIIICCDGTWQDSDSGDGCPSNVTRFARSLKSVSDEGVTQIIYYQSGVGSGTGLGLSEHVREAFVFISNNYHVGDELFILGFSRGAFTARSIAGLIDRIGILTRRGMESFSKIYRDYINFRLKDQAYINKQGWERIKGITIKALGCWDTVGALGIPASPIIEKCKCNEKYKFHDTDLTSSTENAFHALALDERRLPFAPTLWRLPIPAASERHTDIVPNLKQVWFPGGGGYEDQELSDLTLVWMIDQMRPFLGFDLDYVKSLGQGHSNNWASGAIFNSFRGIMKGAGSKVRTPGTYFPDPPRSVVKRAFTFGAGVFGQPGVSSITNEEIHPSVRGRMVASNGEWCSRALFGWKCDKRVVQSAAGPVERWVWKDPETGTELFESDLGDQEKVLAGAEVLSKLESLVTVPSRKRKSMNMDKGSVDSKWDEQPE
ncbi:hypothetical protein Dda_2277 [Drechslerella dactyloides]|uniref:T6SS Phospholipase effector Tle1-like catalytic domain-containing protein n=1 Tax=Drechslerella dactyloides TaxID=74499 RepID=A0AAD6NNS2_DREDA|nr:hypothetical protein Dda_2277 [Drechslerella dactyloides]